MVASLVSIGLAVPLTADAHPRCGTRDYFPAFRNGRPAARLAGAEPKQEREGYGAGHQVRSSANFSVRWRDAMVSDAKAQLLLDELEKAWTLYVDTFKHRAPFGTDQYKLNVYLSAGANDDPAIDFAGGYATADSAGYPHVVMSSELLADDNGLLGVAAHELYHDFQISLGGFQGEESYWYWEATAEWAAQEMRPNDTTMFVFVGAYALTEELPIFYYGDPFGTDQIAGVHQYGASVMPKYFTDTRDRMLVPRTWEQGKPGDDAFDAFMALVANPAEVADTFATFAAHTAYWDVPTAAQVKPAVDGYANHYPQRPRTDAKVPAEGADWQRVPDERMPRAFGYNTIELARPGNGILQIDIEAEQPDSHRAVLVRETPNGFIYTPVPFTGAAGALTAPLDPTDVSAQLVVAAIANTRSMTDTFPYRFRVAPYEPPPDEPTPDEDGGGCGCSSSTNEAPSAFVLVLVTWFACRRRRGST
jgi:hypothetical protein